MTPSSRNFYPNVYSSSVAEVQSIIEAMSLVPTCKTLSVFMWFSASSGFDPTPEGVLDTSGQTDWDTAPPPTGDANVNDDGGR